MKRRLKFIKDILSNIFLGYRHKLFFISENFDWVIDEEGKTIIKTLAKAQLVKGKTTSTPIGLRKKILHFGSIGTLVTKKGIKKFHKSNKAILSWFHIVDDDERVRFIPELNKKLSFLHTASNITKDKLVRFGADLSKIVIIPLGVDISVFQPDIEERIRIRQELKIKDGIFAIGSFQKDGDGWGEGFSPKLIKGPDVFCSAVKQIASVYPIHVILTGPARGYVKKRLESDGISYSHIYLEHAADVSKYYNALDLYLVCSREEGGPKAIMESMASGVPVISTRVGMAPDIIQDGIDGLLVGAPDANIIAVKAKDIISDKVLREKIINNAFNKIKDYSSQKLAESFYYQIYKDLLE